MLARPGPVVADEVAPALTLALPESAATA